MRVWDKCLCLFFYVLNVCVYDRAIRNLFVSRPGSADAESTIRSERALSSVAAPASNGPARGLGRGLAGILDDRLDTARDVEGSGLEQLLGRSAPVDHPKIRQFVAERALGVIADGFDAEAVVICRRERSAGSAMVSSRIPPSWRNGSTAVFELYGQLWNLLDTDRQTGPVEVGRRSERPPGRTIDLDGRTAWLGRQPTSDGRLAAAVVRARPFSTADRVTLNRLVRSVAVAIGPESPGLDPSTEVSVVVKAFGRQRRSEVRLVVDGRSCRAKATGETADLAVAAAAAKLAPELGGVSFAGRAEVDDNLVALVVAHDHLGSPLLGLSVAPESAHIGLVEAVFAAAAVGGPVTSDR